MNELRDIFMVMSCGSPLGEPPPGRIRSAAAYFRAAPSPNLTARRLARLQNWDAPAWFFRHNLAADSMVNNILPPNAGSDDAYA